MAQKKFINSSEELLINDDIDAIIQRGEERTIELNSKYEGLNLEDLSSFKSEASVLQWEGEDFRPGRKALNFNVLSLSKRERKSVPQPINTTDELIAAFSAVNFAHHYH